MTLNREQEDEWSNKCNSGYREVDHQQRKKSAKWMRNREKKWNFSRNKSGKHCQKTR